MLRHCYACRNLQLLAIMQDMVVHLQCPATSHNARVERVVTKHQWHQQQQHTEDIGVHLGVFCIFIEPFVYFQE